MGGHSLLERPAGAARNFMVDVTCTTGQSDLQYLWYPGPNQRHAVVAWPARRATTRERNQGNMRHVQ